MTILRKTNIYMLYDEPWTSIYLLSVLFHQAYLSHVQSFRLTQHCFEYFIPLEDGHTTKTCSGY
jgi:hypothetical protein